MLIQTTQEILDYDGKPIPQGSSNLTVRDAIFLALNNFMEGEQPSGEDKLKTFRITQAVFASPTAELSLEDATFIKERSGKITAALVHGRLCELLESAGQIPAASNGEGKVSELAAVE